MSGENETEIIMIKSWKFEIVYISKLNKSESNDKRETKVNGLKQLL